ncbi:MAG: response regulator [Algicola sp.]|nr:response regulator [Algicola sp.]
MKTVFESFNQMRLNHKRQFGGVGLGLSIAKHLIELFQGTITIESEQDKGTDVFVELPLKQISKANLNAPKTEVNPNTSSKHVLVVEDNKLNQMVMRKLLSSSYIITFAVVDNGKEAIEALKKDVYDVILMDLQMPVMDGYEATKIIRSGVLGDSIGKIPIIAVTADAMQETRQRVLDLGMNDYMTKPVNKELLLKKMEDCNPASTELKIA